MVSMACSFSTVMRCGSEGTGQRRRQGGAVLPSIAATHTWDTIRVLLRNWYATIVRRAITKRVIAFSTNRL